MYMASTFYKEQNKYVKLLRKGELEKNQNTSNTLQFLTALVLFNQRCRRKTVCCKALQYFQGIARTCVAQIDTK